MAPYRAFLVAHGKRGRVSLRAPKVDSKIVAPAPGHNAEIHQHKGEPPIVTITGEHSLDLRVAVQKHRPVAVPRQLARMALLVADTFRDAHFEALREWVDGGAGPDVVFFEGFIPGGNQERVWLRVFEYEGDLAETAPRGVAFGLGPGVFVFHPDALRCEWRRFPLPPLPATWRPRMVADGEVHAATEATFSLEFSSREAVTPEPDTEEP
jgi:hypothetical protein